MVGSMPTVDTTAVVVDHVRAGVAALDPDAQPCASSPTFAGRLKHLALVENGEATANRVAEDPRPGRRPVAAASAVWDG